MTKIEHYHTQKLFPHPENPRYIVDEKFEKLKRSLEQFPEMMEKRPLVINQENQVLGGNMRLRAALELGWEKVPVIKVDWDEAKQREFIIKDNSSFGNWDFDVLANEWDADELNDWGLDAPTLDVDIDDLFDEPDKAGKKPSKHILVLEFRNHEELEEAKELFAARDGSNAEITLGLLRSE